ncbi:MAG: ABC transporter permease, partial [Planctomycetaceae bacterium]
MKYITSLSTWMEKYSDKLNPILVKETRQALKSRQFVATFMLLLLAAWLVTISILNFNYDQIESGRLGEQFFGWYFWIMAIAVFIVVPYGSYRSLMSERDENTYELLVITSLSPTRIVWGKLFSGMVQLFIYYSVITPFI